MKKFTRQCNRYIIYILVAVLPIFFLPWTSTRVGADTYNKMLLLQIAVFFLVIICLLVSLRRSRLHFSLNLIDIPLLALLAVFSGATVLALDKYASLLGYYGQISQPLIMLISLAVFYFILKSAIQKRRFIRHIIIIMLSVFSLLTFASLLIMTWFNGTNILSRIFRLMVGSNEDFSIYLSLMSILLFALLIIKQQRSWFFGNKWFRSWMVFTFIAAIFALIRIDFTPAWWLLLFGNSLILLIYVKTILRHRKKVLSLFWLIILFLLPINFLLNNYIGSQAAVDAGRLAQNMQMDYQQSWQISKATLLTRPWLGYGPDNTVYAVSQLRGPEMNHGEYWDLRFNKAATQLDEIAITTGWLGIIAFLALALCVLLVLGYYLFKARRSALPDNTVWLAIALSIAALSALMVFFVYSASIIIQFIFWLFLALALKAWQLSKKTDGEKQIFFREYDVSLDENKYVHNGVIFALLILVAFGLAMAAWQGRNYLAEVYFSNNNNDPNIIAKAIELNPKRYNYQTALAKFYVRQGLNNIKNNPGNNLEEVNNTLNKGIDYAKKAIATAPFAVITHETIGMIYRDIAPYSDNNEYAVVKAFKDASSLEPNSPVLLNELGNAYERANYGQDAINSFKRAIELKKDYLDAQYGLANAYARTENQTEAIDILKNILAEYNISDETKKADILFLLGKIYFSQDNYSEAKTRFAEALATKPLHSNALFGMALVMEETDDLDQALYYFKKVLKINPGNTEVQKKIAEVEKKREENK